MRRAAFRMGRRLARHTSQLLRVTSVETPGPSDTWLSLLRDAFLYQLWTGVVTGMVPGTTGSQADMDGRVYLSLPVLNPFMDTDADP